MSPEKKRLIDLLAVNKKGMRLSEIAIALGLDDTVAKEQIKELEGDAAAYKEDGLWKLNSYMLDRLTSDRFRAKDRKCLRCRKMFLSAHAGNRICPRCEVTDAGMDDSDNAYVFGAGHVSLFSRPTESLTESTPEDDDQQVDEE